MTLLRKRLTTDVNNLEKYRVKVTGETILYNMLSYQGEEIRKLNGPVLLTGHTGFKGAWMSLYLQALGIEVAGFSLPPTDQSLYVRANLFGAIQEQFGDISEKSELQRFVRKIKPSAVIHFAAQSLVRESFRNPATTFSTNVMGTVNVLDVARNSDSIQGISIITTDKVYENRNLGRKFKESDSVFGKDPYSASKAAAENVVAAWRSLKGANQNPSISVMRAGNVIGGGDISDNRLLPDIVRAKLSERALVVRNPQSTRPWQHVLDPLAGYLSALEESIKNKTDLTLNFGPSEDSLTVQEVVDITKKEWPTLQISFEKEVQAEYEAKYLDLDSTEAKRILNWQPIFTQQDAIIRTLYWWDKIIENPKLARETTNEEIREFMALQNSKSE